MRHLAAVVAICLGLGAAARPARACSKRHQSVFELFDLAANVAVTRVTTAPGPRAAGMVGLRVRQTLKGRHVAMLAARETNTSCRTGFRTGRTALVFLAKDRWPVGDFEGYLERPSKPLLDALTAWATATTDAERAAILVAAAAGTDVELALDAALYLVDQPALVTALTADQIAALVTARGTPRTDDAILAVIARHHGQAWKDAVAAGLPPRSPALAALAAHDYEAITATDTLADLIAQTPGESSPIRIAAFERCERIHGRALENYTTFSVGRADRWWLKLAEACRTGTRATW